MTTNKNESLPLRSISFVIPAFNEQKLIRECITSIKVTMENNIHGFLYEIIVVDNNSTDWTADYAKAAGAKVFKEKRPGVVFARQLGLMKAKYNYIANIDADSMINQQWLDTVAKYIDDDKQPIALTGPLFYNEASLFVRYGTWLFYKVAWLSHHIIGPSIQGGNSIILRAALLRAGGFDTSYQFYGEDTRTAALIAKNYGRRSIKMLPQMIVTSSDRRLKNQGVFNTTITYIVNYLSTTLFNRPITKHHQDYR